MSPRKASQPRPRRQRRPPPRRNRRLSKHSLGTRETDSDAQHPRRAMRQAMRRAMRQLPAGIGRFEHESTPSASGRPYMSAAFRTIEPGSATDVDPDLLPTADRALLRLLARHGAVTPAELVQLVYT